jgi:hypothetical protein
MVVNPTLKQMAARAIDESFIDVNANTTVCIQLGMKQFYGIGHFYPFLKTSQTKQRWIFGFIECDQRFDSIFTQHAMFDDFPFEPHLGWVKRVDPNVVKPFLNLLLKRRG